MKRNINYPWLIGIIAYFFISIVLNYFPKLPEWKEYIVLALPLFCSFAAAYSSKDHPLFFGFSYALIIPLVIALWNFVTDIFVKPTDFPGLLGFVMVFQLIFILVIIPVTIGALSGSYYSQKKSLQNNQL